jgi:hypothetical protein
MRGIGRTAIGAERNLSMCFHHRIAATSHYNSAITCGKLFCCVQALTDSMEGPEASTAIPGFSSLSLSRPDSYSAAGRVADASIHVLKQPQPMLYSPTSGLSEHTLPAVKQ